MVNRYLQYTTHTFFISDCLFLCLLDGIDEFFLWRHIPSHDKGWSLKKNLRIFIRYVLVSLLVAGVDYSIFWVSQYLLNNLFFRLMLARSISIVVQYLLVKFKVFFSKLPTKRTFPAYVLLVVINGIIVDEIIKFLGNYGIPEISAKVISEIILYLPNFWILKEFVFQKRNLTKNKIA